MKVIVFALTVLILFSCTEEKSEIVNSKQVSNVKLKGFQELIDKANIDGAILVFKDNVLYSNDFKWAEEGRLPASTFKIPNSIIALELGIMEDDSTMIYWDGEPRYQKRWEQDLLFRNAFHFSCVPTMSGSDKIAIHQSFMYNTEDNPKLNIQFVVVNIIHMGAG